MKRSRLSALCLLLVVMSCSTIRKIPRHESEWILGELQLHFDVPGGDQEGQRSFSATVDLEKRRWSGVLEGRRKRYCIYSLDGEQLHLELTEEISSTTRSATRTFFDPEGNPMTIADKTGERIEWLMISIKGEFRERGDDFVAGPFQGVASKSQVVQRYRTRSQRLDESETKGWEGSVTGLCMLKEQQVSRLQIRQQR